MNRRKAMMQYRLLIIVIAISILTAGCVTLSKEEQPQRERYAKWHAVHLIGYNTDDGLRTLEEHIPTLDKMGINVVILEIDYAFEFKSHPELRSSANAITRIGARRLASTCRRHGIRLIPQFQCLGHQSWKQNTGPLLTKYPELDLTPGAFPDNKGIYCREWDLLNPKVNKIIFALMDELIGAFQADAFHVGMDEVFLLGHEKSPSTKGKDPAILFAKAVNEYYDHLVKTRKVEMLMWGDRLIDAKKLKYGKWEASNNGTAPAIDLIPKDIIICDWHYGKRSQYPSIPMFIEKGFRVIPSGWNKVDATRELIKYSKTQRSSLMLGHLFTTWSVKKDALTQYPPIVEGMKILHETLANKAIDSDKK